jgi:hypothetical protein
MYQRILPYCHYDELKEKEFNLNVPRYVDRSELEENTFLALFYIRKNDVLNLQI